MLPNSVPHFMPSVPRVPNTVTIQHVRQRWPVHAVDSPLNVALGGIQTKEISLTFTSYGTGTTRLPIWTAG